MGNKKRILCQFKELYRYKDKVFIKKVFKKLLHRSPDSHEKQAIKKRLYKGESKLRIICELVTSNEAKTIYEKTNEVTPSKRVTIAQKISQFYSFPKKKFIRSIYKEFFVREPKKKELKYHLRSLKKQNLRLETLKEIIESDKFKQQFSKFESFDTVASKKVLSVGFFLGFKQSGEELEGEGIGRFSFRLIHGLLQNKKSLKIYVACLEKNYSNYLTAFNKYFPKSEKRIILLPFSDISRLNEVAPVDIWIIPYIGMSLALKLKKPFILCLHDLVYLHFKEEYYNKLPSSCRKLDKIVQKMKDKAAAVVFSSNFVRDHEGLRFLNLPLKKAHVIRLASPDEEYQKFGFSKEKYLRKKYKLYKNYIIYPSVIRIHKNHDRLIRAFIQFIRSNKNAKGQLELVLTDHYSGKPMEKEIVEVLNSCNDKVEKNSIRFLGRVASKDLPSLYKYAIGTIVPTLYEGSCPFPILESSVVGTPIVISRIPVTQELIIDLEDFMPFDPRSEEEMVRSIGILWNNYDSMFSKQKNHVNDLLQRRWKDVGKEYLDLIQSIRR